MSERLSTLVVGGGLAGMATAIAFRQQGFEVDLIDVDPDWKVIGAGITITGPTLRAFRSLELLDAIRTEGFMSSDVKFFTSDGVLISVMPTPVLEPGIPPAGGILRPALHKIMSQRVIASGAHVELGVTVEHFLDDGDRVSVRLSNGRNARYDVMVGADGIASSMRSQLFPDAAQPEFVGQGCWRVLARRPTKVNGAEIYFGPGYKVGLNPCAPDWMYGFVTMGMPGNPFVPTDELLPRMREILAPIGGNITAVREDMNAESMVNYRPLEALLLDRPWHKGRVGLVGDAVHATTPHLASGAGMAVEDAVVLAESLATAPSVEQALSAYADRRWTRCRTVVDNSLLISRLEQNGNNDAEIARLMSESVKALAEPM